MYGRNTSTVEQEIVYYDGKGAANDPRPRPRYGGLPRPRSTLGMKAPLPRNPGPNPPRPRPGLKPRIGLEFTGAPFVDGADDSFEGSTPGTGDRGAPVGTAPRPFTYPPRPLRGFDMMETGENGLTERGISMVDMFLRMAYF